MATAKASFSARGLQPGDVVGTFELIEKISKPIQTKRGRCYTYSWHLRCRVCGDTRTSPAHTLFRYAGRLECRCKSPTATHGESDTAEYRTWFSMIGRCYSPSEYAYRWYGAVGKFVCKRWRDSVLDFIADVGRRPGPEYSIDRIDSAGSYTCGKCEECEAGGHNANCRWATRHTQHRNMSNNLWFTRDGETMILKDWCRRFGLVYRTIHARIYTHGWSFEKAITTPTLRRGRASHPAASSK